MKVNRFRRDEKRAERKNIRRARQSIGIRIPENSAADETCPAVFLMEAIVADKETILRPRLPVPEDRFAGKGREQAPDDRSAA